MKKLILLMSVITFWNNANSQDVDVNYWKKYLSEGSLSYFQKIDSINTYFNNADSLKSIRKYGYKDFLRWQFFWENRLDTNGKEINLPKVINELLTVNNNGFLNKSNSQTNPSWHPIGLQKKPVIDVSNGGGVGMIYCLEINPLDPDVILAGTPNGGIWRTNNAGISWHPLNLILEHSPQNIDLGVIGVLSIKIDPVDTSRIFIGTGSRMLEVGYIHKYSYGILVSENSGNTWKRTGLDPGILNDININSISIVGSTTLANVKVFGVSNNSIYKSTNGGQTFVEINLESVLGFSPGFKKIEALQNSDYIVATGTVLYTSTDGGINWNNNTNKLGTFTNINRCKNSGFDLNFYDWTNTNDWEIVNNNNNNVAQIIYSPNISSYNLIHRISGIINNSYYKSSFSAIIPPNCSLIVKYYKQGNIANPVYTFNSNTNSNSLQSFQINIGQNANQINRISYEFIILPGFNSSVLPALDNSSLYAGGYDRMTFEINPNAPNKIRLATVTQSNAVFLFEEISMPNLNDLTCSYVNVGAQVGWAHELASSAYDPNLIIWGSLGLSKSTGATPIFSPCNYTEHSDIRSIKIVRKNNSDVIYIAHDGGLAVSLDNGQSFIDRSDGLQIANFYNLAISELNPNLIVAGLHDNGTNVLYNNEWMNCAGCDGFGETLIVDDKIDNYENTLLLSNCNNSNQLKATISNITSPQFSGFTTINANISRFIDKSTDNSQAIIYKVDRGYKGYQNKIYKSINRGSTWTIVTIPTNVVYDEIARFEISDDNQVWVIATYIHATYQKDLYVSQDGGASFTKVAYPINLYGIMDIEVQKVNNQYLMWVALGSFDSEGRRVYKSANLGATWEVIEKNTAPYTLGEFPVNTIVYDKFNNKLIAGTDRGVYYFDESLDRWYEYNDGLPKCIITKLVISYSNGKLRAATFGRGVWETDLQACTYISNEKEYIEGAITYSTDIKTNKDIIILANATLTITGKLLMPNNSNVIIKKGGKLIIDGGVISNYCGGMWNGITVEGNEAAAQSASTHGWVIVKNNGLIENARVAIKSLAGGIVQINGGDFLNNRYGVSFNLYSLTQNGNHANLSYIKNSSFLCSKELNDPLYTDAGVREGSKSFVNIAQQDRIFIYNNKFNSFYHPRSDLKGNGIVTWNSRTEIRNNTFTGLTYGVESSGYLNPLKYSNIINNEFKKVSLAITETAQSGTYIRDNIIELPEYESNNWLMENYGIQLESSRGFNISSNSISVPSLLSNANTYGVLVKNSGNAIPCNIEHNNFLKLEFANQLEEDNEKIVIQCNEYNQSIQDWSINPITVGAIHNFGSQVLDQMQAANSFLDNTGMNNSSNIRLNESMAVEYFSVSEPITAIPLDISSNVTVSPVSGTEYNGECEMPFDPCGGNPVPCVVYAQELVNNNSEAQADLIFKYKLNLAQQYIDSGVIEELKQLLEIETGPEWDEIKLPIYIEYGTEMNVDAQDIINNLSVGDYKNFMQTMLDFKNSSTPIDSIGDGSLWENITSISNGSSEISAAARKILELFYNYQYVREAERWEESSMIKNNNDTIKSSLVNNETKKDKNKMEELGLNERNSIPNFLLIPNPSNGDFVVKLISSASGSVFIIDMHGKVVNEVKVAKNGDLRIGKGFLAPGIYTIRLLNGIESYQLNKRMIILE